MILIFNEKKKVYKLETFSNSQVVTRYIDKIIYLCIENFFLYLPSKFQRYRIRIKNVIKIREK